VIHRAGVLGNDFLVLFIPVLWEDMGINILKPEVCNWKSLNWTQHRKLQNKVKTEIYCNCICRTLILCTFQKSFSDIYKRKLCFWFLVQILLLILTLLHCHILYFHINGYKPLNNLLSQPTTLRHFKDRTQSIHYSNYCHAPVVYLDISALKLIIENVLH
jgi:hypothetical protein